MTSKKERDYDRAFDQATERLGMGLRELDRACGPGWTGEVDVTVVKVRLGDTAGMETLVIIEGTDGEGTPVVAFHSGVPPSEAVAGAMRRLVAGSLRWKVDSYKVK